MSKLSTSAVLERNSNALMNICMALKYLNPEYPQWIMLENVRKKDYKIEELKQLIFTQKKIPIHKQILSYQEMSLEDDKLLSDYKIPNISSITLTLKTWFYGFDNLLYNKSLSKINLQSLDFNQYIYINNVYLNMFKLKNMDIDDINIYKIHKSYRMNLNIYKTLLSTMKNKKEKTLYHGTSIENIEKIICNGFNRDFNIHSKYGKGTYFSKFPQIAAKYSKRDDNGYYAIFVCKVIIGQYTLGQQVMNQDLLYKSDKVTQWDSFVNNLKDPTIFVINRDYHAIPVYIIILNCYKPISWRHSI